VQPFRHLLQQLGNIVTVGKVGFKAVVIRSIRVWIRHYKGVKGALLDGDPLRAEFNHGVADEIDREVRSRNNDFNPCFVHPLCLSEVVGQSNNKWWRNYLTRPVGIECNPCASFNEDRCVFV
jgi:hypothetical protein